VQKSWAIMRRDLIKLSRNPLTMVITVLLPIIYLVIFGNSFQGVLKRLPVVVVAQDNGPYGIRMMEKMQALAAGPRTLTLTYEDDPGAAIEQVRDGRFKSVLIIPAGFSKDIEEGRIGELGLFSDNVDTISTVTLENVIQQAANTLRGGYVTAREPNSTRSRCGRATCL
jgi:ABC-2 type transport system permease protein